MNRLSQFLSLALLIGWGWSLPPRAAAELLDRVVAVVEDDVILDSELRREVEQIARRIADSNMAMPPEFVLRRQVLEKLVVDKLQRQLAERSGVQITEEILNNYILDIARRNNMSLREFKRELERQGIPFQEFSENIRNEIIINQLRAKEIGSRIKVTDREIDNFLETNQSGQGTVEYHLGHILIAVPEAASSSTIQRAKNKADEAVQALRQGQDFAQTAMRLSDSGQALKGGDLGWRTLAQIPTLFADIVKTMRDGEVSEPIRSPSGFHIIKLLGVKGGALPTAHWVTQTQVRHILIKPNDLIDDEEAQRRLFALRTRIINGEDFAALARAHSDDKASALKGGMLDWVGPGALVPAFEEAMNRLAINELSQPVQTMFGWHLIQVLGRQQRDNSVTYKKEHAAEEIRKRKIEEETELWLRRLRDESYVEILPDAS